MLIHLFLVLFPFSYSLELKVLIYFKQSLLEVFVISHFPWNVSCLDCKVCKSPALLVHFQSLFHVSLLLFCKCVMKQFVGVPRSTVPFNGNMCEF